MLETTITRLEYQKILAERFNCKAKKIISNQNNKIISNSDIKKEILNDLKALEDTFTKSDCTNFLFNSINDIYLDKDLDGKRKVEIVKEIKNLIKIYIEKDK